MGDQAVPDKNATAVALLIAVAFSSIALLSAPFIEYGEGLLAISVLVGRQLGLAILPWTAVWAAWRTSYSVLAAVWAGAGLLLLSVDPAFWFFQATGGGLVVLAVGVLLRSRLRRSTEHVSFR